MKIILANAQGHWFKGPYLRTPNMLDTALARHDTASTAVKNLFSLYISEPGGQSDKKVLPCAERIQENSPENELVDGNEFSSSQVTSS